MIWHPGLSARTAEFSKEKHILMICNELNRARNNISYPVEYKNCLERAIELTDIFSSDPRWKKDLRELRRGRNRIAQQYVLSEPQDTQFLQRMFLQLSSAAFNMMHGNDYNG